MKSIVTLLLALFTTTVCFGNNILQKNIPYRLEKLNAFGSVLYIAAHPDDENTRLISYLTHHNKWRTAYLSLTRGDGGQNLIGSEQGTDLGLIRTQELLEARKIDGAEQFFSRAFDFGYSKTPEETFKFWNKGQTLADVVFIIRKFKPDIIITRFPTTGEGGHGHHTASAILAEEAFNLAANPLSFPEQLAYVSVWRPKLLLWNTFNFGGNNTTAENQIKLNVGSYNPLLGISYGEIAAASRSKHSSQGFGTAPARGNIIEYFKVIKNNTNNPYPDASIFRSDDGMFPGDKTDKWFGTWQQDYKKISNDALKSYQNGNYESCLQLLHKLQIHLQDLSFKTAQFDDMNSFSNTLQWIEIKKQETESLILDLSGFYSEITTGKQFVCPGDTIPIRILYTIRSLIPKEFSISIAGIKLKNRPYLDTTIQWIVPKNQAYSQPYWLSDRAIEMQNDFWGLMADKPISNKPFQILDSIASGYYTGNLNFTLHLDIGTNISQTKTLKCKILDPSIGEVFKNIMVVPPVTVTPIDEIIFDHKYGILVSPSIKTVSVSVKAFKNGLRTTIQPVNVPKGYELLTEPQTIDLAMKGDEKVVAFQFRLIEPQTDVAEVFFSATVLNQVCNQSYKEIAYNHIETQFDFRPKPTKFIYLGGSTFFSSTKIGYISGAGDKVPEVLRRIGYDVTELDENSLKTTPLNQFKVIITGVRAHNVHTWLANQHENLMLFVQNGGILLVQYNTNNRIGPLNVPVGPYPFTISRERVTDETAKVTFTDSTNSLLSYPYTINSETFKNWIQERGIYFVTDRDSNYRTLFLMHDSTEKATDGCLIYCNYGFGRFVYTGLSFFRQLPAGVPGAYKLFVNLISTEPAPAIPATNEKEKRKKKKR